MRVITNMVNFCQNYRLIEQKSIDKSVICLFHPIAAKVSMREYSMMLITNMVELAKLID